MTKDWGLVLAGGGAKGSYQIGVWRALRELGLEQRIGGVSGTSIGALNMALFLQGDLRKAEQLWASVGFEHASPVGKAEADDGRVAYVWNRPALQQLIKANLDLKAVGASDLPAFACCDNGTGPEYVCLNRKPAGRIMQFLLASSAVPKVYAPVEIDGKRYADGAFGKAEENVPVRQLIALGFKKLIVVHLDPDQVVNAGEPEFVGVQFVQILPSRDFGTTGKIDFQWTGALDRMQLGYRDAIQTLAPFVPFTRLLQEIGHELTGVTP